MSTDFGKVAVLMGGESAERDISLQGGKAVWEALLRRRVDAYELDARRLRPCRLLQEAYQRVFIMLHGAMGEDGVVQGTLEMLGLPYTGSGVLASALAMDKCRSKQLWQSLGLPTAEFMELQQVEDLTVAADSLGFPLIIKPVQQGSSLGISKVYGREGLAAAWESARNYDARVMAERFLPGAEYTVSLLRGAWLPVIQLQTSHDFYDYEAKYEANDTRYICPSGLADEQEQELGELSLRAFAALGCSGWGRIDLIMDAEGVPWLLEVNTIPGMTSHSLVPMAASQAGIDFDELTIEILRTSLQDSSDADPLKGVLRT